MTREQESYNSRGYPKRSLHLQQIPAGEYSNRNLPFIGMTFKSASATYFFDNCYIVNAN